MLILILGLLIGIFVTFIILLAKDKVGYREWPYWLSVGTCWGSGVISVIIIIAICCSATSIATESVLDNKIAMYQEENAVIEQEIDKIVDAYMKHEQNTFADLKTEESSITLVTLFPELKSDELVQEQLQIYVSNNSKIKELKEDKIDIAKKKWVLYFGK